MRYSALIGAVLLLVACSQALLAACSQAAAPAPKGPKAGSYSGSIGAATYLVDLPKSWNKLDLGGMKLRLTPDARLVVRYGSGGRALAVVDAKEQRLLTIVRVP